MLGFVTAAKPGAKQNQRPQAFTHGMERGVEATAVLGPVCKTREPGGQKVCPEQEMTAQAGRSPGHRL